MLNVGLSDGTVAGLARWADDRFAHEEHARFVLSFAHIAFGVDRGVLEQHADELVAGGVHHPGKLIELVGAIKAVFARQTGRPFPEELRSNCGRRSARPAPPGTRPSPGPIAPCAGFRTRAARR
jgi:hypothetical protein